MTETLDTAAPADLGKDAQPAAEKLHPAVLIAGLAFFATAIGLLVGILLGRELGRDAVIDEIHDGRISISSDVGKGESAQGPEVGGANAPAPSVYIPGIGWFVPNTGYSFEGPGFGDIRTPEPEFGGPGSAGPGFGGPGVATSPEKSNPYRGY